MAQNNQPEIRECRPYFQRIPPVAPDCRHDLNGPRILPKLVNCPRSGNQTKHGAIDSFHATPEVIEEFGIEEGFLRLVMTKTRESGSISVDPAKWGRQQMELSSSAEAGYAN